MILPTITELTIIGVADRGVPNRERILLRPAEAVNLQAFFITLGVRAEQPGMIRPLHDHVFWFPEEIVSPPSWIVVYTGPGSPGKSTIPESGQPAYTFHWGKQQTVLNDANIVPVLFGLGSVLVPSVEPQPAPPGIFGLLTKPQR